VKVNIEVLSRISRVRDAVREVFLHRAYLYVVGSALYKMKPRDLDLLLVVRGARDSEFARFGRLVDRIGGVKVGTGYAASSDRIIGDWNTWIGVISLEKLDKTPPVLLRTWRENYLAVVGPPLGALVKPVKITLDDVIYGMYGVKYCEDVLANNRAYEIVLSGDTFIMRKVVLNDEQRRFFKEYCRKWIRLNLVAAGIYEGLRFDEWLKSEIQTLRKA